MLQCLDLRLQPAIVVAVMLVERGLRVAEKRHGQKFNALGKHHVVLIVHSISAALLHVKLAPGIGFVMLFCGFFHEAAQGAKCHVRVFEDAVVATVGTLYEGAVGRALFRGHATKRTQAHVRVKVQVALYKVAKLRRVQRHVADGTVAVDGRCDFARSVLQQGSSLVTAGGILGCC